ncbi:MAG: metal ABC transporter substrate-binding protein [Ruminococcus sp.]|nr:metal ABC transporter substrate-binding protein [Ruminococcus sp.]
MKKILSIILSFTLLSGMASIMSACNTKERTTENSSGKISIVTSIFPYYDFVKNIAGDKAEIKLLLSPGNEPHNYEPSPSDIVAIENCDIFIYNGGESDEWVESVLESLENSTMKQMKMMDYVTLLHEQSTDHDHSHTHIHEEDEEENHSEESEHSHEEEYDEHIWTSVRNAEKLSTAITDALCEVDSDNSDYYRNNCDEYSSKLKKLDESITETVENSTHNTVVFGDRFPFLYFVTDYDLEYECAFPGCNSNTEPSISTVTHMIDFVREEDIPVVFYLEFSNGKTAKLIAEDTGAKTMRFSSCHNVTKDEFKQGVSYISLMEQNLEALKEALA